MSDLVERLRFFGTGPDTNKQTMLESLAHEAADEIERLNASWEKCIAHINDQETELARLRQIIADAPHDETCPHWHDVRHERFEPRCDCWKSRVGKEGEE